MYEKICCIYDADEYYAMRLSEAINSNGAFPIRVMAFTSKEAIRECMDDYDIELILMDEKMKSDMMEEFPDIKYIILSEGENDSDKDIISRYQSTDRIVMQLLNKLGSCGIGIPSNGKTIVTSFYSPSGRSEKTLLALAYSHIKGRDKKVLYINLEEYSGIREIMNNSTKSLSDVIYQYYIKKDWSFSGIMDCIGHDYGFDYISPVTCPDDIGDMREEDLWNIIDLISKSDLYDELVIDVGNLVRKGWLILSKSTRIYVPIVDNYMEKNRMEEFEDFLRKRKLNSIKQSITGVSLCGDILDNNIPLQTIAFGHSMEKVIGGL